MVRLLRISESNGATCGVLFIDGFPLFSTLEPEWADNKEKISCIPCGEYKLVRVDSPKFGQTFEITGVPNRSLIRMHWGNTDADTEGCPIVGLQFGKIRGKPCVWRSREAHEQFMEALHGIDETTIVIDSVY